MTEETPVSRNVHRLLNAIAYVTACITFGTAVAHHSYASFDKEKTVSLRGTVVEWQWTNPHTFLTVAVPQDNGEVIKYEIEGSSPSYLSDAGFSRNSIKAGDKVSVQMHPHRARANFGELISVTLADGKSYSIDLSRAR